MARHPPTLFAALLRHHRNGRKLSQLDLSLEADVSSRHISFLETGRAAPTVEMIDRLAKALSLDAADLNALLRAAGYPPRADEPEVEVRLGGAIGRAIQRMKAQQEPYPLMVMNSAYDILDFNLAMARLAVFLLGDPSMLARPNLNAVAILLEDDGLKPYMVNWEVSARMLLGRLHRELLTRPDHKRLHALKDRLAEIPGIPPAWHAPDLTRPSEPIFRLRLRKGNIELTFFSVVTVFSAPQNLVARELVVESFFPMDTQTEIVCRKLAEGAQFEHRFLQDPPC